MSTCDSRTVPNVTNASSSQSRRVQNVNYTWNHDYEDVTSELGEASELVSTMLSFEQKPEIMWLVTPDHLFKMEGISSNVENAMYRIDVVCSNEVGVSEGSFDDLTSGNFLAKVEEEPVEMTNFKHFVVRYIDKAKLKSGERVRGASRRPSPPTPPPFPTSQTHPPSHSLRSSQQKRPYSGGGSRVTLHLGSGATTLL